MQTPPDKEIKMISTLGHYYIIIVKILNNLNLYMKKVYIETRILFIPQVYLWNRIIPLVEQNDRIIT